MEIRLATETDIPGLLALLGQVGLVHHDIRPDLFPENTMKYDRDALAALLRDERRPVFVAMRGDFVAGYCFCVQKIIPSSPSSVERRELYIDDLCVDAHCRRQGVADSLYRHVLDYAKNLGCAFVTLNVWSGNRGAMEFYLHQGMRPRNMTMEISLGEREC